MMSAPPRMVIQQNMARIASLYHASATFPRANHSDFFNTHAWFQQLTTNTGCRGINYSERDPVGHIVKPRFRIAVLCVALSCALISRDLRRRERRESSIANV